MVTAVPPLAGNPRGQDGFRTFGIVGQATDQGPHVFSRRSPPCGRLSPASGDRVLERVAFVGINRRRSQSCMVDGLAWSTICCTSSTIAAFSDTVEINVARIAWAEEP
jgi:hypothetical protein